jgi:redox-sensing transcriptional repressor
VGKIEIPKKTVYRLSIYLRCLERLIENQVKTVSSVALAKAAGVKPPQLRKDLGYVGQFGTRGLGYKVDTLSNAISNILGTARLQPVVIIGVGNLGSALMRYSGFKKEGFEIVAAFDQFPELVEERIPKSGIPVYDVEDLHEFIGVHEVKMAILSVPGEAAQQVANALVEAGVQAILNFSPLVLQVPENVIVNHVDLAVELESLSYFIS